MPEAYPIDAVTERLQQALNDSASAVLQAPPGAGKTTRVPLALLSEPWLAGQKILMLEPRRLAATNAARFMASQLGEQVGRTVGYAIRYRRQVSKETRIEVVTEGILTRRLQGDPTLEGVGLVIFDEFHERSLNSDLALALCRDVQLGLRDDLRLLVMSATLDAEPVARLLGDAPLVTSAGRRHPVQIRYLGSDPREALVTATVRGVRAALAESDGDLLVFLPGAGEIRRCCRELQDLQGSVDLRPLFGDLPFAEQERAILPGKRRRVVLATNIAETSLTIEGVKVVVDSGWERRPRFDAARGMSLLERVRISAASAEQRAGRAGRLGPGACYRLWSEGEQGALIPFAPPQIRTDDLAPLALELASWGVNDASELSWLDPPPEGHLAAARHLLQRLGGLDAGGRLTPLGREMARLPAHPRLARMLLGARENGLEALGADLAALLSERDILPASANSQELSDSDLLDRLEALRRLDSGPVRRAARYWRRKLGVPEGEGARAPTDAATVGRLLAAAFPDRIARRRREGSASYLLSGGQGARLSKRSAVRDSEWLVAVEMAGRPGEEGEIRLASALTRQEVEELAGPERKWERVVEWDPRAGRVVAKEQRRLGALVLVERPGRASAEEATAAVLEGIGRLGLECLDWTRSALQFAARVEFLRRSFPEGDWPDLSSERLLEGREAWLGPFLDGVKSRADLQRIDPLSALQALLGWRRQRELDRLAPERIEVPSGSRIRLDYGEGEVPILAVKLQELFGLEETPTVAGGRVPVLLHLLSPARRPIQVTRDLKSFWQAVYPEVKKELKGRYPKHPWPDDPSSAVPTARAKRRR